MPNYNYKAINQSGAMISGTIRAETVEMAETMLSEQGYIPAKISREGTAALSNWLQKIETIFSPLKQEELILFTKQFRTMLIAGIPILQIFKILENQTENKKLKNTVAAVSLDIREGLTLYDAFIKHPRVFSPLYTNMIRAGEQSGTLSEVMERLIYILEHEHKVRSDIRSAMQYPIIVVAALMIAFLVLLTFVIPRFVTIFARAGVQLPIPTRISIALYNVLSNYWPWLLALVIIGVIALPVIYRRTETGRYLWDSFTLSLPIVGQLFLKSVMSRFASVFSILQSSGVPVLRSLEILAGTIGNQAITREFLHVRNMVEEGRGISSPLRSARYFTPMVVDMIAIGEESGRLEEMLREISVHYDDEVGYAVKRLSDTIGPILIIGLAAVVGFFALSIFLPMWDLTQVVRRGF
ncbi:MAG TPA: type II secretion system F family protein [Deltaproteobacteria bacterium]|nr:type II secretion system F family protein [Deltaproteobacteria bacterium]